MLISLRSDHRGHLQLLTEQSTQVYSSVTMSLFRKPKKTSNTSQRRAFISQDTDDDNNDGAIIESLTHNEKPRKKCATTPAPSKPLLSFGGDDEEEGGGEVFQVKKSSQSKKVTRALERERQRKQREREQQKVGEALELSTPPAPPLPAPTLITATQATVAEAILPMRILSGRDALGAGKDDLSDSDEDNDDIKGRHTFMRPSVREMLESGAIPDAATIHAARKSRQRAREMNDFIPVGEEMTSHEDDSDLQTTQKNQIEDSDEEEGDRLDMDVNLALRDEERRREQFYAVAQEELDDEWEHQQLRKGVVSMGGSNTTVAAPLQPIISNIAQPIPAPPPSTNEPRTPQTIAARLRKHLEEAIESRTANLERFEDSQRTIQELALELEQLKVRAPEAAQRFRFYQELRAFISDLVECFDEKMAVIEQVEQRALDHMRRRSNWLMERRRQDVRDQTEESSTTAHQVSNTVGQQPEEKVRRAAEREGRRTRRRRARELTLSNAGTKHVEGMSSDDEISQQDQVQTDREYQQICADAKDIFDNVVDEYADLNCVLARLERWKRTDPQSYTEAYVPLCLPRIVAPLIRHQMYFWDPLNRAEDALELDETFDWYRSLALYGGNIGPPDLRDDVDVQLVPMVVDKIVVPKLAKLVENCWDPMSTGQTLRLVNVVGRYIRKFPTLGPASRSLTQLFEAILARMQTALEHDVFIPVGQLTSRNQPFFRRQFGAALKLLKNVSSWLGVLNDGRLRELALVGLLNRYLLSAIKFCTVVEATGKLALISQILPRYWLQSGASELAQFNAAVAHCTGQLDVANPTHLEAIETVGNIARTLRD